MATQDIQESPEQIAQHEEAERRMQSYKYVRTGADHYSLAFTYDCVAWSRESYRQPLPFMWIPHSAIFGDEDALWKVF